LLSIEKSRVEVQAQRQSLLAGILWRFKVQANASMMPQFVQIYCTSFSIHDSVIVILDAVSSELLKAFLSKLHVNKCELPKGCGFNSPSGDSIFQFLPVALLLEVDSASNKNIL
jgi:hypothetical protein